MPERETATSRPIEHTQAQTRPALTATDGRSRVGMVWITLIAFVIVLLLLGVFILQNSQSTDIRFFGAKGTIPFGLAMLFAALAGVVLTLLIGSIRIIQLKLMQRSNSNYRNSQETS